MSKARAFWFDYHLLLWISGEAPTPCYQVDLERSLLDVEPPGFIARWRPVGGFCPEVVTPYDYRETFKIGERRDQVVVHTAEGALTVDVENYAPDTAALAEDAKEAVGYSDTWDFAEAFREAVRALPPRGDIPDWLARYKVVETGAEIGGLAGLDRLFVRVRGG